MLLFIPDSVFGVLVWLRSREVGFQHQEGDGPKLEGRDSQCEVVETGTASGLGIASPASGLRQRGRAVETSWRLAQGHAELTSPGSLPSPPSTVCSRLGADASKPQGATEGVGESQGKRQPASEGLPSGTCSGH